MAVSIAMSGCSKHAVREGDQVVPRARLDRGQMPADNPNRLYDDNGELLESNLRIASLALPRGLTEKFTEGRLHSYETTVPAEKLQRYFGPRLITGSVERIGEGAIYRMANVRGAPSSSPRVDVAILPLSTQRYSVAITELARETAHPPSEESLREALRVREEQAR
ncbi:MAG: hypothetical protein IPK60_13355 [Sandaracinaceae bacterium]|nr:hypothetical protein [Sandaracinaceae bacterium]